MWPPDSHRRGFCRSQCSPTAERRHRRNRINASMCARRIASVHVCRRQSRGPRSRRSLPRPSKILSPTGPTPTDSAEASHRQFCKKTAQQKHELSLLTAGARAMLYYIYIYSEAVNALMGSLMAGLAGLAPLPPKRSSRKDVHASCRHATSISDACKS